MHKKVSIAVPVYNVESTLNRCVDSILNQTYENFELILVDDCSTDNSLKICHEYAQKDYRVIVVEKTSHTVLSDVRNVGIENASGEYIMFVDSDDYVYPSFVAEMVRAIEEKNVDAVRCKAKVFEKNGTYGMSNTHRYENKIVRGEELKQIVKDAVTFSNNSTGHNTWLFIIRLNKLKIKFNTLVYCAQDLIFFTELLLESISSIYFLDKALYCYCYNEKGITHDTSNYYRYIDSLVILGEELKKILSRNNLLDSKLEEDIDIVIFEKIKHKILSLRDISILKTRAIVKNTIQKKEIKELRKKTNVKPINF